MIHYHQFWIVVQSESSKFLCGRPHKKNKLECLLMCSLTKTLMRKHTITYRGRLLKHRECYESSDEQYKTDRENRNDRELTA